MGRVTERRKMIRIRDGAVSIRPHTLATETGLTLIGFLRGPSMNVYAGEERLTPAAVAAARG